MGGGEAIEILNCLQITDINQLPVLISPTTTLLVGSIPDSYNWALETAENIDQPNLIRSVKSLAQEVSKDAS